MPNFSKIKKVINKLLTGGAPQRNFLEGEVLLRWVVMYST